jgi:hypothetical protein
MKQTLADISDGLHRFLLEAEECAEQEYGFAAMLTLFPVMLGIAEAMQGPTSNARLLTWFVSRMDGVGSWMLSPTGTQASASVVGKKLADIRDSLAHQFSLPSDVMMANCLNDAQRIAENRPEVYVLATRDTVREVGTTAQKIVAEHPKRRFDPDKRGVDRAAARRMIKWMGLARIGAVSQIMSASMNGPNWEKLSDNE